MARLLSSIMVWTFDKQIVYKHNQWPSVTLAEAIKITSKKKTVARDDIVVVTALQRILPLLHSPPKHVRTISIKMPPIYFPFSFRKYNEIRLLYILRAGKWSTVLMKAIAVSVLSLERSLGSFSLARDCSRTTFFLITLQNISTL